MFVSDLLDSLLEMLLKKRMMRVLLVSTFLLFLVFSSFFFVEMKVEKTMVMMVVHLLLLVTALSYQLNWICVRIWRKRMVKMRIEKLVVFVFLTRLDCVYELLSFLVSVIV